MKFERKVYWMNHKYYFELGVNLTSLLIKILAVVGIAAAIGGTNKAVLFILGMIYSIFCYVLGWFYVKYGFYTASLEVSNRLNKFVREVRNFNNKRKI